MIPEIKKILYATDLSKNSLYASLYAVDMAKKHGAKIVILHSVEPFPSAFYSYSAAVGPQYLKEDEKRRQEADIDEIRKRVEEVRRSMEDYVGSSCAELVAKVLVPLGHPVEEILEAADKEDCDAIVLGTHGKGLLKQTFLGSTAAKVLERTSKPVFIIPLPSEKADIYMDKMW